MFLSNGGHGLDTEATSRCHFEMLKLTKMLPSMSNSNKLNKPTVNASGVKAIVNCNLLETRPQFAQLTFGLIQSSNNA